MYVPGIASAKTRALPQAGTWPPKGAYTCATRPFPDGLQPMPAYMSGAFVDGTHARLMLSPPQLPTSRRPRERATSRRTRPRSRRWTRSEFSSSRGELTSSGGGCCRRVAVWLGLGGAFERGKGHANRHRGDRRGLMRAGSRGAAVRLRGIVLPRGFRGGLRLFGFGVGVGVGVASARFGSRRGTDGDAARFVPAAGRA